MAYAISDTPTVFVDHEALHDLVQACGAPEIRAVLVGFGEYAKHLVNLCPEKIAAIYDPNPLFVNRSVSFRGIPVLDLPGRVEANLILGCEYNLLYEYLGRIVRFYDWIPYFYPRRLNYKITDEINVFEQEALYRDLFRNEKDAPISMMNPEKLRFLIELLRTGLMLDPSANVLEMGSWQGGSSWFMARTMSYLKQSRTFYMLDLFETHMMDPTATMCTDEIAARMTAVYGQVEMIVGLVGSPECLARVRGPLCFAHIDLGCEETGLSFAWANLLPGAPMLLDNYGHLAAPTWKFDDFFLERGARVIRLPWSEQGVVFK